VALLNRLTGQSGAHVVHCELMRQDFLTRYDSRAKFLLVPPTIVSEQLEVLEPQPHSEFTVGFLSNVTLAKGIDDALATFQRLANGGRAVRFIVAGPIMGPQEQALIDAALARWPGQIEYRGPAYGREKAQFFADIDVLILPTRNESWGIVLTEALAAGRPIIARSRGCVPWIVQGGCGLLVDPDDDFVTAAARQIEAWIDAPEFYQSAQAAARQRCQELQQDALRQLPAFVEEVLALGQR